MSNTNLSELQLVAALAEEIYRRNGDDIPITLSELDATAVNVDAIAGLTQATGSGAVYYYSSRGFVGEIVEKGNTVYVVFRGTDSAESFLKGALKADINNQYKEDLERKSDLE
jgi:hypothetical protein